MVKISKLFPNKYKCIIDQELALARSFLFTHQVAAVFSVKCHNGQLLASVTSNQKSDSLCAFSLRTSLPNFILIRFEMMVL